MTMGEGGGGNLGLVCAVSPRLAGLADWVAGYGQRIHEYPYEHVAARLVCA